MYLYPSKDTSKEKEGSFEEKESEPG